MDKPIDLRSDTVTVPTEEMRRAMAAAEVGDDVYGEDPTVRKLEELAAEKMGKEAGLFVVSGTMGNLVAVMTHCKRGDEVILEKDSHIYYYEVGGISAVAGAIPRLVTGNKGIINPEALEEALRLPNIHFPPTTLLCLENTHNRAGGTVTPVARMRELCAIAHRRGLKVHLDGARIFNAAIALGISVAEIASDCDSVMFCLSKGLGAPVGSVLVGRKDWIEAARKNRKMVGGGMRQAGVLAAAGIVALEKMVDRLAEDHENARRLATALAEIPGFRVDLETVQTNIVGVDVSGTGLGAPQVVEALRKRGVKCNAHGPARVRFVTHKDVTAADIEEAVLRVRLAANEWRR